MRADFLLRLFQSVLLVELFYTACCLSESLSASVERMAVAAGIYSDLLENGTCFEFGTAGCADNLCLVVIRMNTLFHVLSSFRLMPLYVHKESCDRILSCAGI